MQILGMVARRLVGARRSDEPTVLWARVVRSVGERGGTLEGAVVLTPYTAQILTDHALRAGRGGRLELTLPAGTSDDDLAAVRSRFGWLRTRGVQVLCRSDRRRAPARRLAATLPASPKGRTELQVRSTAVASQLARPRVLMGT
jgi:hypothetical protein